MSSPTGQAEEVQQRGADVEEVGPVDALVFSDAGTLGGEDAKLPVLDRRAGRLARDDGRTQVIGVEPVVGHEDHGRLLPGELQQRAEHHVVVTVSGFQAVIEDAEVPFIDVLLPWAGDSA